MSQGAATGRAKPQAADLSQIECVVVRTHRVDPSAMAFGILLVVVALNFILNKLTKGEFSI